MDTALKSEQMNRSQPISQPSVNYATSYRLSGATESGSRAFDVSTHKQGDNFTIFVLVLLFLNIFEPKELFPLTSKHVQDNPKIDSYTYMTLMNKHLTRVQDDIKSKEVEIQKQKCDFEEISQRLTSDDDLDSGSTCSFCHCKDHREKTLKW